MSAVIVADNVGHTYKSGTVALEGVNLEIGTGLFGLLGSNGAGKSTLMRIICTLLVPAKGRVSVDGLDVVNDRRAVRKLFGYLPQEFSAWRLQTVAEVLDTLAALSGVRGAGERKRRVSRVLESVGLNKVSRRKVKHLSGGMRRRLGVAQALIHEPKILIVDEPTVGLDPEERLRFRRLMTQLASERVILLSTHIVADLGSGCGDLALLDRGRVVYRGAPADLVDQAAGKVVEVDAGGGSELDFVDRLEIVQQQLVGGRAWLRGVIKGDAIPDARVVEDITLEEAYLAFMVSLGRNADDLDLGDGESLSGEVGAG
jgi:ABC-2 type transport system ATP-binding protein